MISTKNLITIMCIAILNIPLTLAVDRDEVMNNLEEIEDIKDEMQLNGFSTNRMNDLIILAYIYVENKKYDMAQEMITEANNVRIHAISTKKDLQNLKSKFLDFESFNISIINQTRSQLDWELVYAGKDFREEAYEETQIKLENIYFIMVKSLEERYRNDYSLLLSLEDTMRLNEISLVRVETLKLLYNESVTKINIEVLEAITEEIKKLEISLREYEKLKDAIPNIEIAGLSSDRLKDGLKISSADISLGNYNKTIDSLRNLINLSERALLIDEKIENMKITIDENKNEKESFKEAESMIIRAKEEVVLGNYEDAEQLLIESKNSFDKSKAGFLIGRISTKELGTSIVVFLRNKWPYMLGTTIIVVIIVKMFFKTWIYVIRKWLERRIEGELRVNKELIKKLQRNYFSLRKISRNDYEGAFNSLNEKNLSLNDKLLLLKKKCEDYEVIKNGLN